MNKYRYLTPVEIIEYLCQGSANGFRKVYVDRLERWLGLSLPAVLRDFLLRVGRERVCIGEKDFLSSASFRKEEGYLIIGEIDGAGLTGISLEDMEKDNPPVYLRNVWGRWDILAESTEAYLLVELDRRLRKSRTVQDLENEEYKGAFSRYFYCKYLLCEEQTDRMDPSEVFVSVEKWSDIFPESDGDEEPEEEADEDPENNESGRRGNSGKMVILPQELKDFLFENKVFYTAAPYCVAICQEAETGILYSACFPKSDRRFVSLLQINDPPDSGKDRFEEKLFKELAERVHDPVMANCRKKIFLLPERVRGLAEEQLHIWSTDRIGDFLDIFEENPSWELGICESDRFIKCSGKAEWYEDEYLSTQWYGYHLREDPPFWTPAYRRGAKEEEETPPEELEPFLKEMFYQVHEFHLLNRYAFLAGKIVKKEGYSKRIEAYTDEERFALLAFYREIVDGIIECLLVCLEKRIFSVRIDGRDFTEFCKDPSAHLAGWMNRYKREELAFLEEGRLRR